MQRADLRNFVLEAQSREKFLQKIAPETDEYRRQLGKLGSACPIHLIGPETYRVSYKDVQDVVRFLKRYPEHVVDYVLTAILLDDAAKKDEDVVDLLEDLTAPEG